MVASDSTLLRVLGAWDLEQTRQALYGTHLHLRNKGQSTVGLGSGRKVKLAIVDGSQMGGFTVSALAMAGEVYHLLGVDPSPGRGHELATSRRLLRRAVKHLGKGFTSHVVYDGLAANRIDLVFVHKQIGAHWVVKTQDETLEIIQSSKQAWEKLPQNTLKRAGVEMVTDLDKARSLRYEIYAQGGISWEGFTYPLKLAWVKETPHFGLVPGQDLVPAHEAQK